MARAGSKPKRKPRRRVDIRPIEVTFKRACLAQLREAADNVRGTDDVRSVLIVIETSKGAYMKAPATRDALRIIGSLEIMKLGVMASEDE